MPISNFEGGLASKSSILLSNITSGAVWQPRVFYLDRQTGLVTKSRKKDVSGAIPDGLAANIITVENGRLSGRVVAIYLLGNVWTIFDGRFEYPLDKFEIKWAKGSCIIPGFVHLAYLIIGNDEHSTNITYFRPTLRHGFEEGWALDDIDICHLIARLSKNKEGLERLRFALKVP